MLTRMLTLSLSLSPSSLSFSGIIDILQQYNGRKWGENLFKKTFTKEGGQGKISAVPPKQYADRFVKYMREHTE
jgi:hypothetical protein